ncbi:MAG: phosphate/phosphite/phosphonate ABC transporter substrate-binding protein [Candidatus Sulfotelmatobacter sp.]
MFWRNGTGALLAVICVLTGVSQDGADRAVTLAVVMDSATKAEREPLRAYLTQAMKRPVRIAAPDTYRETVTHLGDGSYDFACLGALMYIRARQQFGVIPLVRRAIDLHYHTVFITQVGSSIHSINDLRGRQFAFGDADSTSAHLIAEYELKRAGVNPEIDLQLRYSGSHPATAALVAAGAVDAGAIDETVFRFLIGSGKLDGAKVRVFYTSQPYVDYVYVARKDLPVAEQEAFAHALLDLNKDRNDPALKILRAKHFVLANDREYDSMRQIAHELKMF